MCRRCDVAVFAPHACARIARDWTLATEVRADSIAAAPDGDPAFMAELPCRHARAAIPDGALGLGATALIVRVRGRDGVSVWVRRDDRLTRVLVEELVREGAAVAVRAPLAKGELVVSRASEDLVEGPWPGASHGARAE